MNENTIEMQELHCHACDRYVQFPIDLSLDGCHTLKCPNCGHEHFRVVEKGIITGERWQSSGPVWPVSNATSSTVSIYFGTASRYGTSNLWASSYTVTNCAITS
jgi:hypothetical protein